MESFPPSIFGDSLDCTLEPFPANNMSGSGVNVADNSGIRRIN